MPTRIAILRKLQHAEEIRDKAAAEMDLLSHAIWALMYPARTFHRWRFKQRLAMMTLEEKIRLLDEIMGKMD